MNHPVHHRSEATEDDIYQERILDHYKHPHHWGTIKGPTFRHKEENPLCGDVITIFVQLDRAKKVRVIRFQGFGCAISQASASLFTDHVTGKGLKEILKMTSKEIMKLLGVSLSPTRLKCATLIQKTFLIGATNYLCDEKTNVTNKKFRS